MVLFVFLSPFTSVLISVTNLVLLYTLLFRRPQAKVTEGTGGQLVGHRVVGQALYCIIMAGEKIMIKHTRIKHSQHIIIQENISKLDKSKYAELYRNIGSCGEACKHHHTALFMWCGLMSVSSAVIYEEKIHILSKNLHTVRFKDF